MRISGVVLRMLSYRALASCCAWIENLSVSCRGIVDAHLLHLTKAFCWCGQRDLSEGQNPCWGREWWPNVHGLSGYVAVDPTHIEDWEAWREIRNTHLFRIPYPHGTITTRSVENTTYSSSATPFYNIDTGSVSSQCILHSSCRERPYSDSAIFWGRGEARSWRIATVMRIRTVGLR